MRQLLLPFSMTSRLMAPGKMLGLAWVVAVLGGIGVLQYVSASARQEAFRLDIFAILTVVILGLATALALRLIWRERRAIRDVTQANMLLAVWQYSSDEWPPLAEMQSDYEQTLHKPSLLLALILIFGGLGVIGFLIFGWDEGITSFGTILPYLGIIVALGLVAFWVNQRLVLQQNRKRRMENLTPHLYVSKKGLYHDTEGILPFEELQDIALSTESTYPELVFSVVIAGSQGQRFLRVLPIPIPRQHVPDAQRIVEQFHAAR